LHHKITPLTWLRNSFLAGVAVVLPFAVTLWLIWIVVTFIDMNVLPLLPPGLKPVASAIPGAGVMFAVAGLTLVGALVGNLVGRMLVDTGERFIANLPLVRSIYGGAKQVFGQVASPERTSFKSAVLVEFPKPGSWALGFITNEDAAEVARDTGEELVSVYVPHAPIPTSGFLLYLRKADLKPLAISPEQALKRVLSLGIIRDPAADDVLSSAMRADESAFEPPTPP
jgi:uncharacterized membrane protein